METYTQKRRYSKEKFNEFWFCRKPAAQTEMHSGKLRKWNLKNASLMCVYPLPPIPSGGQNIPYATKKGVRGPPFCIFNVKLPCNSSFYPLFVCFLPLILPYSLILRFYPFSSSSTYCYNFLLLISSLFLYFCPTFSSPFFNMQICNPILSTQLL